MSNFKVPIHGRLVTPPLIFSSTEGILGHPRGFQGACGIFFLHVTMSKDTTKMCSTTSLKSYLICRLETVGEDGSFAQ